MRMLYCVSAVVILGSVAVAGCEVGGDAWPSSRGSGDGGAAPRLSTNSSTVSSSATSVASTSTGAGSTAMTTATGGPIPVPADVDE